ncbi:hypothetical protein ACWDBW_31770 [Streptomyces sp. NPDC001107]
MRRSSPRSSQCPANGAMAAPAAPATAQERRVGAHQPDDGAEHVVVRGGGGRRVLWQGHGEHGHRSGGADEDDAPAREVRDQSAQRTGEQDVGEEAAHHPADYAAVGVVGGEAATNGTRIWARTEAAALTSEHGEARGQSRGHEGEGRGRWAW